MRRLLFVLVATTGLLLFGAASALAAPLAQSGPFITGNHAVGQPLGGNAGTWDSGLAASYAYQWQRCAPGGVTCSDIVGATDQTYLLGDADVGTTLRLVTTASDATGSSSATSAATATIDPRVQVLGAKSGEVSSVGASTIALPDRLFVDSLVLQPTAFTSRGPAVARIHISNVRGDNVSGALVRVTGLPSTWATTRIEAVTAANGWAWLRVFPTKTMPLTPGHEIALVVHARIPGTIAGTGASTLRVFRVAVH